MQKKPQKIQNEINKLTYEMYGLSDKEVEFIDSMDFNASSNKLRQ